MVQGSASRHLEGLFFLIMGYKTTIIHIMMLKNEKIYDIIKVNKCDDIYSNYRMILVFSEKKR